LASTAFVPLSASLLISLTTSNSKEQQMRKHIHTNNNDFDEKGLLKDGHTYRAKLTMMDNLSARDRRIAAAIDARYNARNQMRVTDATGDPMGLHRPGWRVPAQDSRPLAGHVVTDAVANARRQYVADLENAWRTPSAPPSGSFGGDPSIVGAGSRGQSGIQPGDHDDNDLLQDRAPAHLARVHDGTGDSGLAMHRPGFRVTDAPLSDELQRVYDAYERELTTAWRRGAGKGEVVPDAPKATGNDAMPVDDIKTAYRLYCEEISQAWKTPR
jgi:hypothetical protein